MHAAMATRNTSQADIKPLEHSTEFQLFTKRYSSFAASNVFDFTEKRLVQMMKVTLDPHKGIQLMALLEDYREGNVAIAWRAGEPIYVYVTRGG